MTESVRKSNSLVGTVLRATVSIGALGFILSRLDLGAVVTSLRSLDPGWMVFAGIAVFASVAVSAVKWGVLLRRTGHVLGFWRLVRAYFIGFFFNNFLPTSVGGDVMRVWEAGRDIDDVPAAAGSVIAERLVASFTLALTALLGIPFVDMGEGRTQVLVAIAILVAVAIALSVMFLSPKLGTGAMAGAMGARFASATDMVVSASKNVGLLLRQPRTVAYVAALSVVFQVLVAAVNFGIFRALGVDISLAECVVYSSVVSAVTMIPISISGHGVREAGYVYFFGLAGVAQGEAVVASLMFFFVVALLTSVGGPLFIARPGRRRDVG